ncbi:MAG: hypothetical protein LBH53_01060 [Puniceicoccales bacterium]|nr:hypothetical protein [Puniceicoccales bacterium]
MNVRKSSSAASSNVEPLMVIARARENFLLEEENIAIEYIILRLEDKYFHCLSRFFLQNSAKISLAEVTLFISSAMFLHCVFLKNFYAVPVAEGGESWKQLMKNRAVQAAQLLTQKLSKQTKPGFDGKNDLQYGVLQELQSVKGNVQRFVEGEIFGHMGKLVGRKDHLLADELAKSRKGLD